MLTDCAEDASIAMCENANNISALIHVWMNITCCTVFVFFNYSASFSNDEFLFIYEFDQGGETAKK